jgi:hypothetical protein
MKKYTQRELLSEGFWGGLGRGADYLVGKIAPRVQELYKTPYNVGKGFVQAVRGTSNLKQGKPVPQNIVNSIRAGLQRNNMQLSFKPIKYYSYSEQLRKDVYGATVIDPTTRKEKGIYVDKNGNEINPPTQNPPASP